MIPQPARTVDDGQYMVSVRSQALAQWRPGGQWSLPALAEGTQSCGMTAIIFDCDPGHDDAIAPLLALASPELRVLGVTTVYGNQTIEKTTANAIRVLEHVGRGEIPVAAGAPRPLVRERHVTAYGHGETGLDGPDLPPPSRGPERSHAIDWIATMLATSEDPVTLVATAPLTNVALFLARYPELATRFERIVVMAARSARATRHQPPSSTSGVIQRRHLACSQVGWTSRWSGSMSPTRR